MCNNPSDESVALETVGKMKNKTLLHSRDKSLEAMLSNCKNMRKGCETNL